MPHGRATLPSTLLGAFREVGGVRTAVPDESYRVRYTLLTDEGIAALSQVLLARYLERRPFTTGRQPFEILRVETAERSRDPWLGSTSYEALASAPRPTRTLAFDFASPTAFRRGEQTFLFPVPESVFHSLARTWRTFCDIPLPDDLGDFILEKLPASRYELRTDVIKAGKYQLLGFTGQVSYRALDPDPRYLSALNMLADFALYAGVGMRTTQGMGQARRVAPP